MLALETAGYPTKSPVMAQAAKDTTIWRSPDRGDSVPATIIDTLSRTLRDIRRTFVRYWDMSTKDQILSSALHGEALLTARRPELQPLLDHLREVAQGRDDIRVECAGTIAGSWFAGIGKRGEDLVAAGLLMLAGYTDLAELDKWVRIGWERRRGASERYPDSEN
jgi:hypothetical protein